MLFECKTLRRGKGCWQKPGHPRALRLFKGIWLEEVTLRAFLLQTKRWMGRWGSTQEEGTHGRRWWGAEGGSTQAKQRSCDQARGLATLFPPQRLAQGDREPQVGAAAVLSNTQLFSIFWHKRQARIRSKRTRNRTKSPRSKTEPAPNIPDTCF